jgi:hypothetical protein
MGIVDESGRDLDGDHSATALLVLFQDEYLLARLGEVGRSDQ